MQKTDQPLYGEQTRLTLENMSYSGVQLSSFPVYIRSALEVKRACALASLRSGELSPEKQAAVERACRELMRMDYRCHFPVDVYHGGGGIGINMNLNEVIAGAAKGVLKAVDEVNLNQSTSDVCHTALRIALIHMIDELCQVTEKTRLVIEKKEQAFAHMDTIARTCLQDGMAVSAGAVFSGFASALARQQERLLRLRQEMHRVNLGYTVIGSGTGASEAYRGEILPALCEVTGLPLVMTENPYDAAQFPDDLAALSSVVRNLSGIAAKFARDVRFLSSGPETGIGEWHIPATQAGSSFFPGKVNPVMAEMMIQCDMILAGRDNTLQSALCQGEVHLNLWEEMMGFLLMENLMSLTKALGLFTDKCLAGITVDEAVSRQYARASIPLIVAAKEVYGYEKLAGRIKREGLDQVVTELKEHL